MFVLITVTWGRMSMFELPRGERHRTITVKHHQNVLSGSLILPRGKISPPFVLIVHGDGPQDRWSGGGYLPLVNYLVSQGIAVFSWDKPGVGASTGNWLAQTMDDRAGEAVSALLTLRKQPGLSNSRGGYLGFSQAGWVVPLASEMAPTDFVVLAGAAVNWKAQSVYYTGQKLASEGAVTEEIHNAKRREADDFDRLFTESTVGQPCRGVCTREDFERRNAWSDAVNAMSQMHTPVLILMGRNDRNVDAEETLSVARRVIPAGTPHCISAVTGANHGLLRSAWFDYQLSSQWPLWKQGVFVLSGAHAYAPGALNSISSWILHQTCSRGV